MIGTTRVIVAVTAGFLLGACCDGSRVANTSHPVNTTLLDTHAEFRSTGPAPGLPYPIFAAGLHIRNDDTTDIQSIRIDYRFAKREPWRGRGSIAPAGWNPKLEYQTQKCYINVHVPPGLEAFLALDESYLVVEFTVLSVEASTATFTPPESQSWDWNKGGTLTDISPERLRAYVVRKDPPDDFNIPIDQRYKWDTLPVTKAK